MQIRLLRFLKALLRESPRWRHEFKLANQTPPQRLSGELIRPIVPAKTYIAPRDTAIVACYFNPEGFGSKHSNACSFLRSLQQSNIEFRMVECIFPGQTPSLPAEFEALVVKSDTILWQKERLLNVAIGLLPPHIEKIVWVDADVHHSQHDWLSECSKKLDTVPIVQPFEVVVRLPNGVTTFRGEGEAWRSFGSVFQNDSLLVSSGDFFRHGHTGFAWAARRDFLSDCGGLYDACISGSGDHMMAHAFAGDTSSACIDRIFSGNQHHRNHFLHWAKRAGQVSKGVMGVCSGTLLHLWHGETANRAYVKRNQELAGYGFNPLLDIVVDEHGGWRWASQKGDLQAWAARYFEMRREDG